MNKRSIPTYIIRALLHCQRRRRALQAILARLRRGTMRSCHFRGILVRLSSSNLCGILARSRFYNMFDTDAMQHSHLYRVILFKQSALFCR